MFRLLERAGLKIKRSKCLFAQEQVNYLGHVVSAAGVSPDKKKIKAIKQFPTPKNADQVRSFIGLASYYRRFIRNFAEKAHALTNLMRKNVTWQWGADEQSAIDCIRECLTTKPILRYPDFAREFIIHTDAPGYGIGAVLSQVQIISFTPTGNQNKEENKQNNKSEREFAIAYTSKHLNDVQAKWSKTKKEAYAIVHAVKTFYHYLYGTEFTIVTDHRPLEYLMSKKEPTGRLARWALFLQPFNLGIKYRPGKSKQNADCLSRAPVNVITSQSFEVGDWIEAQKNDTFCKAVLQEQLDSSRPDKKTKLRQISEEDNFKILPNELLATAEGRIVVPAKFQMEIMERYHDHRLAGHFGEAKTLAKIKSKYFWPKMTKHIRDYVRNCLFCARRKAHTTCKAPLQPISVSNFIWERIAMDIMGPLPKSLRGKKYILVIMEYSTRYVIATSMRDMTSNTVMRKLIKHVFLKEGIPCEIITDLGTNFQSDSMEELCRQLGVKQLRTTAYHPQTDGAVEKFRKR